MKIMMVIPSFAPVVGGAERQLEGIAPVLMKLGHDLTVVTRRLPGTLAVDFSRGYVVRRLPTWGFRLGFHVSLALYLLARARKYEMVHCHTLSGPAAICSLAGTLLGRPVLLKATRSGAGSQIQRWKGSWLRRVGFRTFRMSNTWFIAVSADTASELTALAIERRRVAWVPNGVAVPLYPRRPPSSSPWIIFTGRLIARKRVDMLLRAYAASRHARKWTLVIVGDGPMRSELEGMARDLGIGATTIFAGELSESAVKDRLARAEIFVLPSDSEGLSNSMLEAMAHGLAVVTTNIPANREVLNDGVSGILFDDEARLVEELDRLAASRDLRRHLGANARESVLHTYSFEIVGLHYHELYRSLATV